MRRRRRARIVATLGPASRAPDMVERLALAGADVFRLNFSHGAPADHAAACSAVRRASERLARPFSVLADLQGPKLRVGAFAGGKADLAEGQMFRFDLAGEEGDARRTRLPHPEIFDALTTGATLLVDDGRMRFIVEDHGPDFAETRVVTAGEISDRKGVNVPDVVLPIPALTEKDRADLETALDIGVDWVAQSFVQTPADSAELRKLVAGRAATMAKLEKPSAIRHLDEILDYVDGVMVARGDLGVEMPPEDVPVLQKLIVGHARARGVPVVVATQMLDSMVRAPAPTRAEASDVATAIYDGADAVMLSAESAVGRYPTEAVSMMDRIISRVEGAENYRRLVNADHPEPEATIADAISASVGLVSDTLGVEAIVTYTLSGSTALRVARERPNAPILALTPQIDVARRLAVAWGVHAFPTEDVADAEEMVAKACRIAKEEGFAESGRKIAIVAGIPFQQPGTTNLLHLVYVP
ncbi:MAG: pyruvate kinase [Caulobacterales bacterium]|nr:pyruvate kinase [Caulobacterales bacterium]